MQTWGAYMTHGAADAREQRGAKGLDLKHGGSPINTLINTEVRLSYKHVWLGGTVATTHIFLRISFLIPKHTAVCRLTSRVHCRGSKVTSFSRETDSNGRAWDIHLFTHQADKKNDGSRCDWDGDFVGHKRLLIVHVCGQSNIKLAAFQYPNAVLLQYCIVVPSQT